MSLSTSIGVDGGSGSKKGMLVNDSIVGVCICTKDGDSPRGDKREAAINATISVSVSPSDDSLPPRLGHGERGRGECRC